MAEQSLKDRTVKGTFWSAIDSVANYAVGFFISIVLARLLSPDDYGLIGIVAIFTSFCNTIINAGFTNALIRKTDASEEDYNTAFVINLGLSVLLYILLYFTAPLIAGFFQRIELIELIRVTTLTMIIGALALVQQTRLTKRIDFKTQTKISLISHICSGVLGIVMALYGLGVWALVGQSLSSQGLKTFLLWIYNKWTPQLHFSFNSFKDLWGFGWKLLVSNVIDTVWRDVYKVVIGRFYSPAVLGQYTRANQFSEIFSVNLTLVIQRVTYPVLSEIQYENERLKLAYRKIIKITMLVTFSGMLMLAAIAKPMIVVLIGEKWLMAATILQIICFQGMLYPLHALNLNMLQVKGRSDLFLKLEVIKKIIAIIPLIIGIYLGIYPMLVASVIVGFVSYYLNAYYSGPLLGYSIIDQIKDWLPDFLIALFASLVSYSFSFIPVSMFFVLPLQIIIGFSIFFVSCNFFKLEEYFEIKSIITKYFKR